MIDPEQQARAAAQGLVLSEHPFHDGVVIVDVGAQRVLGHSYVGWSKDEVEAVLDSKDGPG